MTNTWSCHGHAMVMRIHALYGGMVMSIHGFSCSLMALTPGKILEVVLLRHVPIVSSTNLQQIMPEPRLGRSDRQLKAAGLKECPSCFLCFKTRGFSQHHSTCRAWKTAHDEAVASTSSFVDTGSDNTDVPLANLPGHQLGSNFYPRNLTPSFIEAALSGAVNPGDPATGSDSHNQDG